MQRYESVLGGLTNALNVLQGRFSQPLKIVRASVDALTKGPVIATQDKRRPTTSRRYGTGHVRQLGSYMNCLAKINKENLEKVIKKVILRLPRWAEAKFQEHLKRHERQGQIMPAFKDIVLKVSS